MPEPIHEHNLDIAIYQLQRKYRDFDDSYDHDDPYDSYDDLNS